VRKDQSHPAKPVLSFYGVGGIGKSTLREQAITNWQAHQQTTKPAVVLDCIVCDLNKAAFNPETKPMEFYGGTLRPHLLSAGIKLDMFDLLYMAWWGKTNPNRELNLEDGIDGLLGNLGEASSTLGSFVDALGSLASGIQAVQLGKKSFGVLKQKLRERRYLKEFEDKPLENLSEDELAEHAPTVLAEDILHHLRGAHGKKALCLVLDGFERIQKDVKHRKDLQWSLQELCGRLAMEEDQRVGMILLGREKLEWSHDTQDAEEPWDKLIDAHLLGDLVENDARDFLQKVDDWGQKYAPRLAEQVRANIEPILTAANEAPAGIPRQFHPYTLDLAITLIARLGERFTPERLGHGSAELQERFLRHLKEDGRLEAFQVLALALEFDKPLFDHLVQQQRLKGYTPQDFHKLIGREWTFIRKDDIHAGRYRFHGKMQHALLESLRDTYLAETNQVVAEILVVIAEHFQSRMRKAQEVWELDVVENNYEFVAIILIEHQSKGRLDWETAAKLIDLSEEESKGSLGEYVNTSFRIAVRRQYLEWVESAEGPHQSETATCLYKLASLLEIQGDNATAEHYYRRALSIKEQILGPMHPDTASTLCSLARVLDAQYFHTAAEPLYWRALQAHSSDQADSEWSLFDLYALLRNSACAVPSYLRALAIREQALGPEHPVTVDELYILAEMLSIFGDLSGTEFAYRRILAIDEQTLGPEHADTAITLNNLASLLDTQGDYAGAEPLYRRALAIREQALGPDHPNTATSLNNLAVLLRNRGNYTEAESMLLEAIRRFSESCGDDSLNVASSNSALGKLLQLTGRLTEAHECYSKALAIMLEKPGEENEATKLVRERINELNIEKLGGLTQSP